MDDEHPLTSIGIDYGRFLYVNTSDCFGDPVNRAYKLGEDIARPEEILVTQEVRDRLGDAGSSYRLKEQVISISGMEFLTYKVIYDLPS